MPDRILLIQTIFTICSLIYIHTVRESCKKQLLKVAAEHDEKLKDVEDLDDLALHMRSGVEAAMTIVAKSKLHTGVATGMLIMLALNAIMFYS